MGGESWALWTSLDFKHVIECRGEASRKRRILGDVQNIIYDEENDLAKLCTSNRLSLCDRFKSLASVSSVIPMILFMGVLHISRLSDDAQKKKLLRKTHRISCDMFAKTSLLLQFANSAASLAAIFF